MDAHSELRSLRLVHLALSAGCLFFLVVAHLMGPLEGTEQELKELPRLVGFASLALVPAAFAVFHHQIRKGPFDLQRMEHFGQLRAALIVHWALLEMPCILNTVLLLLTGALEHAMLAAGCLAVLALRAPTASRLLRWATTST